MIEKIHQFIQQWDITSDDVVREIEQKADTWQVDGIDGFFVYSRSLQRKGKVSYIMVKSEQKRRIVALSKKEFEDAFSENTGNEGGKYLKVIEPGVSNLAALWNTFPFTRPVSLKGKGATIGMGDRLGIAGPGHLRIARRYTLKPVLAQQSIRELKFTDRTYEDVMSAAASAVFQEGFKEGYGADGDHLKTIAEIDMALEAGASMITLDVSEKMNADASHWPKDRLETVFNSFPSEYRGHIRENYGDKKLSIGKWSGEMRVEEALRSAVMYREALSFVAEACAHISAKSSGEVDIELSVDETTTPTLPIHHAFIALELKRMKISLTSLAPRFIGEFEKGIDYRGDVDEFERQFRMHAEIAEGIGSYKLSVHSGSDKLSVYPHIGNLSNGRFHLKTAGTSWLVALDTIAEKKPSLYRRLHRAALNAFEEASKAYKISADISAIPDIDNYQNERLKDLLEDENARQMLHISYGSLLRDDVLGKEIAECLDAEEERYYEKLDLHFKKHFDALGLREK